VPTYLQTAVFWATVRLDRKSHHNCETMFGEVPLGNPQDVCRERRIFHGIQLCT